MKKIIFVSLLILSITTSAKGSLIDSLQRSTVDNPYLHRLTPTLMAGYVQLGKPNQHWFFGAQGGSSAFIGKPVGCGDFFDRITLAANVYAGKWFNPNIGMRVACQGFEYKNSNLVKTKYQLAHADLMYNMANFFRQPTGHLPKWDFAPYMGLGLVHGSDLACADEGKERNLLFAFTYGIHARYHISQYFYLSGEFGCFSTFRDFDGYGSRGKLCDNMPSLAIGIGFHLGTPKWKHAIDANPYINQNNYLLSYVEQLEHTNSYLCNQYDIDRNTLNELKKILEIKGLFDRYKYLFEEGGNSKNNYRGLLSLRSRMKEMSERRLSETSPSTPNVLDVPIYFFFQLGKTQLTDESQLINLDELAKVAIAYNLKIHIAGAADSATGSENANATLARERTRFIASELKKRGVPIERMKGISLGGIQEYGKLKDNRYAKVSLYLEIDENSTQN